MIFLKLATYIRYVIAKLSKFIQIDIQTSSDSFYRGFFENKREPGTSFQVSFFVEFFDKNLLLQYYINWPNFITRLCLLPKLFSEICFVFHAWEFDDVMTFGYLKI